MNEDAWREGQHIVKRHLSLNEAEVGELSRELQMLPPSKRDDLLFKALDRQPEEFIDYRSFNKIDLDKLRAFYQPPAEWQVKQLVGAVKDGTLTVNNVENDTFAEAIGEYEASPFEESDEDLKAILSQALGTMTRAEANDLGHLSRTVASPAQRRTVATLVKAGHSDETIAECDGVYDSLKKWDAERFINRSADVTADEISGDELEEGERLEWKEGFFESVNLANRVVGKASSNSSANAPTQNLGTRRSALAKEIYRDRKEGKTGPAVPDNDRERGPSTKLGHAAAQHHYVASLVTELLDEPGTTLVHEEKLPAIFGLEPVFASRKAIVGWMDEQHTQLVCVENQTRKRYGLQPGTNGNASTGTPHSFWFDETMLDEIDAHPFSQVSRNETDPAFTGSTLVFRKDARTGTRWGQVGRGGDLAESAFIVMAEQAARDLKHGKVTIDVNPTEISGRIVAKHGEHFAVLDGNDRLGILKRGPGVTPGAFLSTYPAPNQQAPDTAPAPSPAAKRPTRTRR
jgi:hypothetical protein